MKKKSTNIIISSFDIDNGVLLGKILYKKNRQIKIVNDVKLFNEALNDNPDLIIFTEPMKEFIEILRDKPKNE